MIKKILCPVDFSECSEFALKQAVQMAKANNAKLILVHVAPLVGHGGGFGDGLAMQPVYASKPDPRLDQIELPGVATDRVHLGGYAGEEIVGYVAENDVDMIVMGTHGYGGFTRFLMGSVADYVLRRADCPVTVVRARKLEREKKTEPKVQVAIA